MKRIAFSRKQILRAIHAACVALFFAACMGKANATPPPYFSSTYSGSGSTYTGSGGSFSGSDYFFDPTTGSGAPGYTITINSGAELSNDGSYANGNEIEFDHGSVINSGSLYSVSKGIVIYGTGTVTNNVNSSISALGTGVYIGGNGTVTNAWQIYTGGSTPPGAIYGVDISDNGIVNNTGEIDGGAYNPGGNAYGVYIGDQGSVTNSGNIGAGAFFSTDSNVYALYMGSGTVNNQGGTIEAVNGLSSTNSDAYGVYIAGSGTVNNTDLISAYNQSGLNNYNTGVQIDGNGTVTNSGTIKAYDSESSYGVYIVGNGTVTNNSNSTISAYDSEENNYAVTILDTGTVTNSGYIHSTSNSDSLATSTDDYPTGNIGVYLGSGSVTNSGTITASYSEYNNYGVYIDGNGSVTNSGNIFAHDDFDTSNGSISGYTGNVGVYIGGQGTVNNSGTIESYSSYPLDDESAVNIGVYLGSGTVTNSGFIGAQEAELQNYGVYIAGNGTVTNSGEIDTYESGIPAPVPQGNYGIYIGGNGTVTNSGYIDAFDGFFNTGVDIQGPGTVINTGTIVADEDYEGTGVYINGQGTVYNSGSIYGDVYGVYLNGSNSSLVAQGGLISGEVTASVYLNADDSTVTIKGRSLMEGEIDGNSNPGNALYLDVITSPSKAAALKAYVATHSVSGYYTVSPGYTYTWENFDGGSGGGVFADTLSLELNVDSGLTNVAKAIDNNGLPAPTYAYPEAPASGAGAQFDTFYAAAFGNPEAALNELVGREINQGIDTLGISLNTTLASDLNSHLDNLITGNQVGGFDVGALHISDAGGMYAMSDTTAQLEGLAGLAAQNSLAGTEMSTDAPSLACCTPQPSWGVWASGNVTLADDTGTSTLSNFHSTLGSPTLGFDYRVTPSLVLGLLGSYTTGDANFDDGSKIGLNTEILALYGTWRSGNWHVNGIAGGGLSQYDDSRTTFGSTATSSPDGYDIVSDFTGGYDFHLGDRWNITPEAGLQYTHLGVDSFTESGAGAFDLSEGDQDIDSLRSHIGFKIDKAYSLGKDLTFIPELRAQWYHEFMDNSRGVNESLPGAPALGSFSVGTYSPQRDFALVGVGLNTAFTGYKGMPVGMFINYNAQVGQSDYISNSVNAGIRVDF